MKCHNCGARVKKSEEICRECGKYISAEKKYDVPETLPEELEKAEEYVRNIETNTPEKYDYKDYLFLPSIIKIGGGIVLFIIVICSFASPASYISSKKTASSVICFFLSLLAIFSGVASVIQERKCFLDVTSDRVHGRIPLGFFDTETFDICIEDIIAVNETGFHSQHSDAEVHIITKEKEITVKGSSKRMLSDFSDKLNHKMISARNKHEN